MAIAGNLQADAAGQKMAGPVDPATGAGKAQRAANVDSTTGYGDAAVVLYDDANAIGLKQDDAAVTLGTLRVMPIGALVDDTAPDTIDEGDIGLPRMSTKRVLRSSPSGDDGTAIAIADDGAFTVGTSLVLPAGALVDEAASDSADEGDVVIPRATASRVLRVALSNDAGLSIHKADDAAFTPGTSVVVPIGAIADETAPDSVDEGDVGIPRMTLNRLLRIVDTRADGVNRAYKPSTALLAQTIITADDTVAGSPVTGFGGYKNLTVLLTVAAKTMDASTTLNIYIQTSPDDGTTWDDVIAFTQVTNAAIANGTYIAQLSNQAAAGFVDRANKDATLTANSKADYFCDQLRVKYVSANFAGADTVTVTVSAVANG